MSWPFSLLRGGTSFHGRSEDFRGHWFMAERVGFEPTRPVTGLSHFECGLLWPLEYLSMEPGIGFEPMTCSLRVSCSAN